MIEFVKEIKLENRLDSLDYEFILERILPEIDFQLNFVQIPILFS